MASRHRALKEARALDTASRLGIRIRNFKRNGFKKGLASSPRWSIGKSWPLNSSSSGAFIPVYLTGADQLPGGFFPFLLLRWQINKELGLIIPHSVFITFIQLSIIKVRTLVDLAKKTLPSFRGGQTEIVLNIMKFIINNESYSILRFLGRKVFRISTLLCNPA